MNKRDQMRADYRADAFIDRDGQIPLDPEIARAIAEAGASLYAPADGGEDAPRCACFDKQGLRISPCFRSSRHCLHCGEDLTNTQGHYCP